ncbi:MAG: hypothetical protein CM1200mP18_18170 [Gammaproteobacteria bacterium]|nr:MAG: hypothetical protein CM1200mP18_18170 [Gammaproteobacteria bacterium]
MVGHSDGASIRSSTLGSEKGSRWAGTYGAAVFLEEVSLTGVDQARSLYLTDDLRDKLVRYHGTKLMGHSGVGIKFGETGDSGLEYRGFPTAY